MLALLFAVLGIPIVAGVDFRALDVCHDLVQGLIDRIRFASIKLHAR